MTNFALDDRDLHVAIIMDGNGRWAAAKGLPRTVGHRAGVQALRRTVEAAASMNVGTLTLYAFSSDNWQRPENEVRAIMQIITKRLPVEADRCVREGIRMSVIGRRDRLPREVLNAIDAAELLTETCTAMHVRLAMDYSSRDALSRAASLVNGNGGREALAAALGQAYHSRTPISDVDLLIRTGGEQRLSDFLLWECAYAELYFTQCRWPDFGEMELRAALHAFRKRKRRFGRVVENAHATVQTTAI